jgi:pimeloyl-ACP methyl ester carboxylesterase
MAAYLSPRPPDGRRRPAIVWITGGDCNTIDDGVAQEGPPENDQSASAFRKAGIIMMFPSLRGGNDNPGFKEGFFGEVDDVIAAAEFLARRDFVDPARIYLGGHSTGGTLALLVAECSDRFRAVFSFGPVEDVVGYGPEFIFFNPTDQGERALRAPALWLHSIRRPVFVFEGTERSPNLSSLQALSRASTNPLARFYVVRGGDHFSILAPTTRLIAEKILADDGPTSNIAFAQEELASRLAVRTNPPGARLAQGPAERIEIPGPTVGPGPGRLVPDRFGPRVQPRQPGSGPGVGPGRPGFGPGVRPGGPAFGPRGLPAASQGRKTDLLGGPGGGPFETAGGGQPVLGFDYRLGSWAGQQALADFRPIYARGPQRAQPPFARGPLAAQQVMARDGYAVGALEVDAAEFVNAVRVVFMRIDAQGRLDPKDSYKSDWIGAASGRPTQTLGGDGSKVIGIYGRRTAVLDAVGLLLE